jgi:hypothetical protein
LRFLRFLVCWVRLGCAEFAEILLRSLGGCGAMESLLKVVIEPRPGSETAKERRRKKKKNVLERNLSSSSRYPSMPRYPPSPSHGEIDVSEIRKACFKVPSPPRNYFILVARESFENLLRNRSPNSEFHLRLEKNTIKLQLERKFSEGGGCCGWRRFFRVQLGLLSHRLGYRRDWLDNGLVCVGITGYRDGVRSVCRLH